MLQGDKSNYTDKQKRRAAVIEAVSEKKGLGTKNAEARARATVNKPDGGSTKKVALAERNKKAIMAALTTKQILLNSKSVPNWSKHAKTIHRTFEFKGFLDSIAFVNRTAKRAQKLNHHPDIDIRFNMVTLQLTTHDAGGLTEEDFVLARQCDEDFSKLAAS